MRESCVALRYKEDRPVQGIILTLDFHKEGNSWVGVCLELGTATDDPDLETARKELLENVSLQLEGAEDLGHVENYLKERGVQFFTLPSERARPDSRSWAVAA
jgi:hypothetical protein